MSVQMDQQWQPVKKTLKAWGENEENFFFHCKYLLIYGICIDVEIYFIRAAHLAWAYPAVYYIIIFTLKEKREEQ